MTTLTLALLCPLALAPQTARSPVQVMDDLAEGFAWIASEDDLSVLLSTDGGLFGLQLRASDGRGLAWSQPVRVDGAPDDALVEPLVAFVDEGSAVMVWTDDRYGVREAFVRSYDGATGTLGPELLVPSGSASGKTATAFDADVTRAGAELHVHVAAILSWTSTGGTTLGQVHLTSSTDGGATFGAPIPAGPPVPLSSFSYLGGPLLDADGDLVHVAWSVELASGYAVQHQRSSDGGRTFDFAAPHLLSTGQHTHVLDVEAIGTTLALLLYAHFDDFPVTTYRAAVSTNAGDLFRFGDLELPVPIGDPFVYDADVCVGGDGGTVVAAWEQDGSGHAIRTTDGGVTWSRPQTLTPAGGTHVRLSSAGPGRERMLATWRDTATTRLVLALSYDGGASFGGGIELDEVGAPAALFPAIAFNDRYQNVVATWRTDVAPKRRFVGGLRPQYVEPTGFAAGSTSIGAKLGGFDDGSPLAFVLFSTAAGDLPLPFGDGRNLGLAPAPLFVQSVNVALAGPLAAALAPDGSSALAPLAVPPLPAGLTLHCAALSFEPATLAFGDLSDLVELGL